MIALFIAAVIVAVFALYKWMRAEDRLIDAQVYITRLEAGSLNETPIYEQLGGL